jgi:hypothetical protein
MFSRQPVGEGWERNRPSLGLRVAGRRRFGRQVNFDCAPVSGGFLRIHNKIALFISDRVKSHGSRFLVKKNFIFAEIVAEV